MELRQTDPQPYRRTPLRTASSDRHRPNGLLGIASGVSGSTGKHTSQAQSPKPVWSDGYAALDTGRSFRLGPAVPLVVADGLMDDLLRVKASLHQHAEGVGVVDGDP